MLAYYLNLALRSFRRNPVLTILMVMIIALGVSASMTTYTVYRAVSGDPIPSKSSKLFIPQIDSWGPKANHNGNDAEPPRALDFADAMALMKAHRGTLQSALYMISLTVLPAERGRHPVDVIGHGVFDEFFPMVNAPFRYGSGWSAQDDQQRAQVAVISNKLNDEVFGGGNNVGRTLEIQGRPYRIVGILDKWNPQPRFYDLFDTGGFVTQPDDVFLPFNTAIDAGIQRYGNANCNKRPTKPGFVAFRHSTCVWVEFMVELDTPVQVASYKRFLDNYALQQERVGRYDWPPNNRLRDLPQFLDFDHVVPSDTRLSLLVALGLLVVCLVNTTGLMLAKFMRRAPEIGVRRALGASRLEIYTQFLVEASMIGMGGGVLGLVLTGVGVDSVGLVFPPRIASLVHLNVPLLLLTLLVSMTTVLLVGMYPTIRAARVRPAWQLKSN